MLLTALLATLSSIAFATNEPTAQQCLDDLVQGGISNEVLLQHMRGYADDFQARQKEGTRTVDLIPHSFGKIRLEVFGIPRHDFVAVPPGTVFRQYVGAKQFDLDRKISDREAVQNIVRSQRLVAGYTPYVKSDYPPRWYRETFKDLTGIFLTIPSVKPDAVAVWEGEWVDVELYPDTPLVELEHGRIFLIPGPPKKLIVPIRVVGHSG